MVNIFLDTNILFDILIRNRERAKELASHRPFVSPLSFHIYCYSEGIKIPDKQTTLAFSKLSTASLTRSILSAALHGPTSDLEDNIQLQSALRSGCNYFLTNDKKLQKMKHFGKMKIAPTLPHNL